MRVSMLGSEWFDSRPGGLNRYFADLVQALVDHPDVEVDAAAFGAPPPGGRSIGRTGQPMVGRLRATSAFLARAAADVVDTHFALYGAPAGLRRPARTKTRIVHFHGPWAGESRVAGAGQLTATLKRSVERLSYAGADHLIVLSTAFRDVLAERYAIDPHRISVIPPGVDVERFTEHPDTDIDRRDIVVVRRLERRMGIDRLLRAWAQIQRAYPESRLVVVGDGSERSALVDAAQSLGITHRVVFTGRLPEHELVAQYQRAVVSVVPSLALEGFGLIALESLACGTPVIVTDCGGLPDGVRGLDPSLIVPPDDVDALAARLSRALEGDVPGRASARAHATTFSWAAVADKHVQLYRDVTARV